MEIVLPKKTFLENYEPPAFLATSVDLTFDIFESHTTVKSQLNIQRNPDNQTTSRSLTLNGDELDLISLSIDGTILESDQYEVTKNKLKISEVPEVFALRSEVRIDPSQNTKLEGLYSSKTGLFTQCEAEGFRRITFFPDRPDVMSLYTTTIIADKEKYPILLSNGNLTDKDDLENGRHWARWVDPFPKPSYLFALVAARLDVLEDSFHTLSGRDVKLAIYVEPGKIDQCKFALKSLKAAMRWDEEVYGLEVDLDQYMIVAVSDFNMGAMENKGLNIFNTKYVLASAETATDNDFMMLDRVVAHEYFHNWTGNRVTCRDWFQLSLKEGLTVFRDQQYGGDRYSHAVQRIQEVRQLRSIQFPEDSGPMAHPVRPSSYIEISNFYTATIYEKGAEIVRMIHTLIGERKFRLGMDLYFDRHDGQAVRIEEFLAAMEDASAVDLTTFKPWYEEKGTPTVEVETEYDEQRQVYKIKFKQLSGSGQIKKNYQNRLMPIRLGLLDLTGKNLLTAENCQSKEDESILITISETEETFEFPNIASKPIPSILRGFSAPVTLSVKYESAELAHLAKYDSDHFNRWDAGQTLLTRTILRGIEDFKTGGDLKFDHHIKSVFESILEKSVQDPALAAEMMLLPTTNHIAEQTNRCDPEAIFLVRLKLRNFIVTEVKSLLETTLYNYKEKSLCESDPAATGHRALKNTCLGYLLEIQDETIFDYCLSQLHNCKNMTDEIAALSGLSNFDCPQRRIALSLFYDKWASEELVLDKWFAVQALSRLPDTLSDVESLLGHKDFSLRNPNKVRALIGSFCHGNHNHFHAEDGNGYRFCAKQVIKIDHINPQIAARLARSFDSWKRLEETTRRTHAIESLETIKNSPNLSKDTYEIVSRTLDND